MNKLLNILIGLMVLFAVSCKTQTNNPYNLDLVSSLQEYNNIVEKDSLKQLVNLEEYIPGLVLDIRYATKNNFTGEVIYNQPKAFVRLPVAKALQEVQSELNSMGLGLKIFDAYRPYTATLRFYEVYPDTMFVAAPWNGSRHNRGCAVDVSLIDMELGKELQMPSAFDDFSEKAWPTNDNGSDTIRVNRDILINTMAKHGFTVYPYEWWHYDFKGWEDFKLVNISFEELLKGKN